MSEIIVTAADGGTFKAYFATPEGGSGPGLVLLQEIFGINANMRHVADRFAEEGYVVAVPDLFWRQEPGVSLSYSQADFERAMALGRGLDTDLAIVDVAATISALRQRPECTGAVGAVGYCLGGRLAVLTAARTDVAAAVAYYGVGIERHTEDLAKVSCPMVLHFGETDSHAPPEAVAAIQQAFGGRDDVSVYVYPGAGHGFSAEGRPAYDKPAAWMAHSRTMALLRRCLGPQYDLSALWDEHTAMEFATRDAEATMQTMVSAPYVNHIPTMTGGVGHDELLRFYKHHFIPKTPQDTRLVPISRTIGPDRLVDEMLFCFTHDMEIDWMLPGVAPTGKYVEIPLVAIVNFRGPKLYHEHIYWDQASVLVQIGVLDPAG
ncbi:MAG: dienelactone hydrolase family protein, partial [Alphaproteobacteria bacterium]